MDIMFAKSAGSKNIDLLILDDFGLAPLDSVARMILLEIIEDRHNRKSTIISSQLPIAKWYEVIGETPSLMPYLIVWFILLTE